ncbi:bifunctional phosphoribosylaminoimidazolecarboxamide formyltransferase/IMP cyclohydrolase [Pelosinus sp. UFO1]|uniref:bifunctional phosphoribosylaminoimidazolecarboxamide formyltransferase/IMP cyclohydrolase n=1 Tax=Pelosinus sp. UFO1 TaxID=484770 RepID=UPI0004D142D1|nr:bifunctional phosphoribosylaminoimidazolecarboxamide formyltransferase/IMP cyclohydrolase [Pelosinus sp. UFO1]AIF50872.1 Bifunctional purine biosynthesis protein purH [Pelosinus sp. UFO1]
MNIKRALISVSDKTGLVEFAKQLHKYGVEIISTGGTMKTLREAGIPVRYVSEVTGFPEIMDGRVKTLNPYIHGGILAVRDNTAHLEAMEQHQIPAIDMVVVNLYPFRQTIERPDVSLEDAVENIDIGGPAMIRAASKNFQYVTVVVNPARYNDVLDQLAKEGDILPSYRMALAKEAFHHTAEYDACIANYLAGQLGEGTFADTVHVVYEKVQPLRYGENPQQQAAFYREKNVTGVGVANARQLHGKELSFNNIVDVEAAYHIVAEFDKPAATIIKHTNPCGTGIGVDLAEAYAKAYQADPVSAFGGIIGLNREVDVATAVQIGKLFAEAIIAPGYTKDALEILTKKQNIRLLVAEKMQPGCKQVDIKTVSGGMLIQEKDTALETFHDMKVVTKRQLSNTEWEQLIFAWKVVKHVKSNAIVIADDNQTLGVGAGQMNRVGAAAIALEQAGDKAQGAVMASDAFLPFRDTVDTAAKAGIKAIIQPGGSVRDVESIEAADEHGIAMVFTGIRHFKH